MHDYAKGRQLSLDKIENAVLSACQTAGRARDGVSLIAVSKVQPNDRVEAVLAQGHRIFGENKVQEAQGKWPAFKEQFESVDLHLLGPLQTNKARAAFELFDVIHSLDREKLANTCARLAQEMGHCPNLFIQINTGEEPQKSGVLPQDADDFIALCRKLDLPILGLMCIPPAEETPSLHFSLLRKIADRNGLDRLSMGMSGDFEEAIAFGATHIRVGTAIFGARNYSSSK